MHDTEGGEIPPGLGVSLGSASNFSFLILSSLLKIGWQVSALMCSRDSIVMGAAESFP